MIRTFAAGLLVVAMMVTVTQVAGQDRAQKDDPSILPFVTTDEVIRRHPETGTNVRMTGVIQNFSGMWLRFVEAVPGRSKPFVFEM